MGDISISSDFDAEFARAADLLEDGKRADAEQILAAIRRRAARPAWDARVALLLARDDARRGKDADAAARLRDVSASPIGLDPYRLLLRAEALDRSGAEEDALAIARLAFEADAPFGQRLRAATLLARLLEKRKRPRDASAVLARALTAATSGDEIAELSFERIRLGLASGDRAEVRAAARDLLLRAPTLDAANTTPPAVRRAAREAEAALSPAERGRRGAALVAAGDARRGVALLSRDSRSAWPEAERGRNLLALARGQLALKREREAEATAASVRDDGRPAAFEARLFRCDRVLARLRKGAKPVPPGDPRWEPVRRALDGLALAAEAPPSVRRGAHERLLRLDAEDDRFEDAFAHARELPRSASGFGDGFEPLWRLVWDRFVAGDYLGARVRIEMLGTVYQDVARSRRLRYWRARCLAAEGRAADARPIFEGLAGAMPPDIYARFAKGRAPNAAPLERPMVSDPSTATAAFARVDELLRLRMFEGASAEARALPPSQGRDLRLAQSDFALGRFLPAAAAIKRAIPEIGTAEEGRVPDGWRRLYYPIEEGGFLVERAKRFDLDAAVLRGLVRQESVFDARAKSRAGAMGLTQLMPATAKSLSRSVLRQRYRRAFLYDPGVNAELGAAYLRKLLDQFDGSPIFALAAYNGGPTRIARVIREGAGRPDDELFESIPLYETRDYVRRVLLYSESYRELYP